MIRYFTAATLLACFVLVFVGMSLHVHTTTEQSGATVCIDSDFHHDSSCGFCKVVKYHVLSVEVEQATFTDAITEPSKPAATKSAISAESSAPTGRAPPVIA